MSFDSENLNFGKTLREERLIESNQSVANAINHSNGNIAYQLAEMNKRQDELNKRQEEFKKESKKDSNKQWRWGVVAFIFDAVLAIAAVIVGALT